MATTLIGPHLVLSASTAAPVPRPPQPTSATWIVLSSPAWTDGMATPARAEPAATWPVAFRNPRRDVLGFGSVIAFAPREGGDDGGRVRGLGRRWASRPLPRPELDRRAESLWLGWACPLRASPHDPRPQHIADASLVSSVSCAYPWRLRTWRNEFGASESGRARRRLSVA